MNLISCEGCGVVLDKDRLKFLDLYDDDGNYESRNGVRVLWRGDEHYVAMVRCPACQGPIPEQGELL